MGSKRAESRSVREFVMLCSTDLFCSHNLLPLPIPTGGYLSTRFGSVDCGDFGLEGRHRSHKRQPVGFPIKGYLLVSSILSMGTGHRESWWLATAPAQMLPITGYL